MAGHGGWYWTVPDYSPLPRLLHRIITVCGPLTEAELIAGLHRATRHSPTATRHIPAQTLQAYLASQAVHQQTGAQPAPARPDPARLTATDQAIAAAYTTQGATRLPTAELVRALHAAGIGARTAHTLISLSPLLRQVRPGVQQLRGDQARNPTTGSAPNNSYPALVHLSAAHVGSPEGR